MKKVNTLIKPDGTKKAYVRLTPDYDALDVMLLKFSTCKKTASPFLNFMQSELLMSFHSPNLVQQFLKRKTKQQTK